MSKGYIYTMFKGADPGMGWRMTDPIFGRVPTLGACMPNVRRVVSPGDHIFVISGLVKGAHQYVVGGFKVAEKINVLSAYKRFPDNRQRMLSDGLLSGNIIVNEDGSRSEVDYHTNFEKRLENYIVGRDPLVIDSQEAIARARNETLDMLSDVFKKPARKVSEVIGRWRRLDESQVEQMVDWIKSVK